MTRLEAALVDLTSFLVENRVPYMIIGGFANLHWGVERFTKDLDIAIEVDDDKLDALIHRLSLSYRPIRPDTLAFARRNHLVQIETSSGVPIDFMLAVLPYQVAAIRRGIDVPVAGRMVRLCAPEDLIIHKLASDRPQDALDVHGVVIRQHHRLDRDYLDIRVRELAAGLERPEIVEYYQRILNEADSLPG